MIITRTPFRITLGGGGTDLESYYRHNGGFIFSVCLDKYMYICLNRQFNDHYIRVKYNKSECVSDINDIQHDIARECLREYNLSNNIEITSIADIPAGSGLGSSSCYTVGLIHALRTMKRDYVNLNDLAEEACNIEIDILNKPMGKQDQYVSTFGGFVRLDISKSGQVAVKKIKIKRNIVKKFTENVLIFNSGVSRENKSILKEQSDSSRNNSVTKNSLDYIKESGEEILKIVEAGNLHNLGLMFDEHWKYKKKLAKGITNKNFDRIYDKAKELGVIGGKIGGAGGGGFFIFYIEENKEELRSEMIKEGLSEMVYNIDHEGTKVLANFMNYEYQK